MRFKRRSLVCAAGIFLCTVTLHTIVSVYAHRSRSDSVALSLSLSRFFARLLSDLGDAVAPEAVRAATVGTPKELEPEPVIQFASVENNDDG